MRRIRFSARCRAVHSFHPTVASSLTSAVQTGSKLPASSPATSPNDSLSDRFACVHSARSSARHRGAFTLLEVLVATAVTLLMMISLAQVFKLIGDSMKQGRGALELNNTLRSVTFRLRHDLNNLTIRVDPPADSSAGTGYFEYYDGAMTDFTAMLFDKNNGLDPKLITDVVRSSRIGDMDDILMYTVRAGDSWFTGKVPKYMLAGTPPAGTPDFTLVTISAQHAEVAVFARPLDLDLDGLYDDSDGDGIVDGFQLYYRTLLIRPDLNVTYSATDIPSLPYPSTGPLWIGAFPQGGLPSPACDMAAAHQQCDLSLRRVFDANASTRDRVAANSLEDLMDPANRFAHVRVPISGTASTTMPLLALDGGLDLMSIDGKPINPLYSNASSFVASGFLHPAYVLGQLSSSSTDDMRLGEDLFAGEVLAFDVKGYDSAVALIGTNGADSVPASVTVANFGAAGSDDIILTPNDPAYGLALSSISSGDAVVVDRGGYVDLMWGRKVLNALPYYGVDARSLPSIITTGAPSGHYLATELSGYDLPSAGWNGTSVPHLGLLPFSQGLYSSGKALHSTNSDPPLVLQPTFDTWTTRYESDGILQARLGTASGVVQINGTTSLYNSGAGNDISQAQPTFRQSYIDAGTDGIDNNSGGGVDEITERETMAPFPIKLRGVRVTVRLEDKATRQVKQMSVANEFVTQ